MKYLGIYIKDRKMYFFLTAFICGVTAVINYLYSAPPQAGLYAFKISLTVLVIVCAADYVHFYKKHENLQRHCHLKEVHALEEDAAHTAIERDYQQLVLKLIQEKAQLAEHMQKKQTDMMDYYAIWAHQIKTPIAAVDLLLQVMEENPQEVAEQDIKELKSELFKIDFYVEAVMNYLRLEDLSSDFRFETTAVETVVKKAVKRFAGQFIRRQITLAMENLHSEIETDEKWLLFILEQLLSNAVKYTQKGGTVKIYEKETLLKSDTVLVKVYTTRLGANQVQALSNVNFSVEDGEYVAIMGESGSGKTTLLNILAALDRPTAGEILLNGKNTVEIKNKELSAFRRTNLGFVFQDFNLLDTFSLKDNIFLPLVLSGEQYPQMMQKLEPIAKKLEITHLLEKYPYEVSGGQKQRAAVARALITQPQLILADEPTGALDSRSTDQLLDLFQSINEDGQTIVMVTHSTKAASRAKRVLFIKDGEVFHQIYKANMSDEEMYAKISAALTVLATGGEQGE